MRSYEHFSLEERENLRLLLEQGQSLRKIAAALGRSASSISRELKRNSNKDGSYNAWRGQCLYLHRRKKSRRAYRLDKDQALREAVRHGLESRWSPEIIAAKWKLSNAGAPVAHSTIYRALKAGRLEGYSEKKHLRRGGKRKYCRGANATIKPEKRIHDRPEIANQRGRLGDWELDTVLGAIGQGALVSAVDRKSRYLVLKVIEKKTAAETEKAIIQLLESMTVKSLTMDNGSEFANFKSIEKELKTSVFFADPHSPWQRGSIENINGLIRWFFPKGYNFKQVTDEQVKNVENIINDRPRKCLNWLSPKQLFLSCYT